MTTSPIVDGTHDVPAQIFEKFLQALESKDVSADLVARLCKTLLEDKTFTERALKKAVLDEETLP
jgi:hypothetical protein